jgi:myo-inositol 2-dehydrogenase/D-chiro-inositol 1-dehydrogenase
VRPPQDTPSRRRFLRNASRVALAAPLVGGLPASSLARVPEANEAVRLGWIGVGGRGTSLLRSALNSVSVANLTVGAICDIDPAARHRAIEMCGAMAPVGIHDYKDLLARKDIDAIVIATPIYLHAEHAVAVLEAGKHTYCEKPLGTKPQDVKAIYDAVKKSGKRFQIGFQWRYHSGFLGLVDTVQSGKVGKVNFLEGQRHSPGYPTSGWYIDRKLSGDLIVEQAVHEMNVFCWLLGSHPLRAAGFGGINALEGIPAERTIMDHYAVTYEFPEDVTLTYSHCVYAPSGFGGLHMTVIGSDARATRLDGTTDLTLTQDGKRQKVDLPPLRNATELALQSFVSCVREDKEPLANIEAGRHATLMALLGRTAIHERRIVEWREVAL